MMNGGYETPVLAVAEILSALRPLNIPVSDVDFQSPDPKRWMEIYSGIYNQFVNKPITDGMQQFTQYGALYVKHIGLHEEALSQMGFTLCMNRVLCSCGFAGFNVKDVIEPTRKRLLRMTSAVVNRLRLDTMREDVYDEIKEKCEQSKGEHDKIVNVNRELKHQWTKMMETKDERDRHMAKCTDERDNLSSQIAECQRHRDTEMHVIEEMKLNISENNALKEKLKTEKASVHQEREKMLQKIVPSPDRFKQEQDRLTRKVMELKESIDVKMKKMTENKALTEQFANNRNASEKAVRLAREVLLDLEKVNEVLAEVDQCDEKSQILQEELTALYTEYDDVIENVAFRQGQKHTLAHQLDMKKQCGQQQKEDLQKNHEIYQGKVASIQSQIQQSKTRTAELRQTLHLIDDQLEQMNHDWQDELSEVYVQLDILHNKMANMCKEIQELYSR